MNPQSSISLTLLELTVLVTTKHSIWSYNPITSYVWGLTCQPPGPVSLPAPPAASHCVAAGRCRYPHHWLERRGPALADKTLQSVGKTQKERGRLLTKDPSKHYKWTVCGLTWSHFIPSRLRAVRPALVCPSAAAGEPCTGCSRQHRLQRREYRALETTERSGLQTHCSCRPWAALQLSPGRHKIG